LGSWGQERSAAIDAGNEDRLAFVDRQIAQLLREVMADFEFPPLLCESPAFPACLRNDLVIRLFEWERKEQLAKWEMDRDALLGVTDAKAREEIARLEWSERWPALQTLGLAEKMPIWAREARLVFVDHMISKLKRRFLASTESEIAAHFALHERSRKDAGQPFPLELLDAID
jgi:hypothetical protein